MDEPNDLFSNFQEATRRRAWLLCKALECVPLDRALDLARRADQFVLGSPSQGHSPTRVTATTSAQQDRGEAAECDRPSAETPAATCKPRLLLSPEQRRCLLGQLASGARNAELAAEFGISPRQVQGIRISQARMAKLSRTQEPQAPQNPPQSIEEAVRFLRQQDDVVVRQAGDEFLVNGRFRLGAAELIERANRIRARQGKFVPKQIGGDRGHYRPVTHQIARSPEP